MRYLLLFLTVIVSLSCSKMKIEQGKALMHYYITTTPSEKYTGMKFHFDYVRAHRTESNGSQIIRSVYLEPGEVIIDTHDPVPVFIGSSEIEPGTINGFDLVFADVMLFNDKDTLKLSQSSAWDEFTRADSIIGEGERNKNIVFEINLESSVVLDSANRNWLLPSVSVKQQ